MTRSRKLTRTRLEFQIHLTTVTKAFRQIGKLSLEEWQGLASCRTQGHQFRLQGTDGRRGFLQSFQQMDTIGPRLQGDGELLPGLGHPLLQPAPRRLFLGRAPTPGAALQLALERLHSVSVAQSGPRVHLLQGLLQIGSEKGIEQSQQLVPFVLIPYYLRRDPAQALAATTNFPGERQTAPAGAVAREGQSAREATLRLGHPPA